MSKKRPVTSRKKYDYAGKEAREYRSLLNERLFQFNKLIDNQTVSPNIIKALADCIQAGIGYCLQGPQLMLAAEKDQLHHLHEVFSLPISVLGEKFYDLEEVLQAIGFRYVGELFRFPFHLVEKDVFDMRKRHHRDVLISDLTDTLFDQGLYTEYDLEKTGWEPPYWTDDLLLLMSYPLHHLSGQWHYGGTVVRENCIQYYRKEQYWIGDLLCQPASLENLSNLEWLFREARPYDKERKVCIVTKNYEHSYIEADLHGAMLPHPGWVRPTEIPEVWLAHLEKEKKQREVIERQAAALLVNGMDAMRDFLGLEETESIILESLGIGCIPDLVCNQTLLKVTSPVMTSIREKIARHHLRFGLDSDDVREIMRAASK